MGSKRALGSSRGSTTAGLEPDVGTGRAERERRLHPLPWALPVPLRVHGRYSRAEIMAAFGVLSTESPWIHREGVLWHQASATDLLFITLNKSEALFSPTEPYVCLGCARYESHEGERPMVIRWRLEREIPAAWLPVMALAV